MSETTIPAAKVTDGLPIGTIVAYYGEIDIKVPSTVPEGWLLCNNDLIPEGKEYDKLREHCKYLGHAGKVPDLRGMFLRGSSAGRTDEKIDPDFGDRPGVGTIQKIGSYQPDAFQGHHHETMDMNWNASGGRGVGVNGGGDGIEYENKEYFRILPTSIRATKAILETDNAGNAINSTPRTRIETRPKNVYVNYIIKAK